MILVTHDVAATLLAIWAAFSVRLGEFYVPDNAGVVAAALISLVAALAALHQLKIYRVVLRYFDFGIVSHVLAAAAIAAGAWVLTVYFGRITTRVDGIVIYVPRSVGFIYCGFLFAFLFMGRYSMAWLVRSAEHGVPRMHGREESRVAIYGANPAGISLAASVRKDPHYRLLGFVDDDRAMHGQIVAGLPVHAPHVLNDLVADGRLDEVFLAIPKATRSQRLAAISRLTALQLKVKTVPAPEEIVSGRFAISDVRPVEVNDLLRRDPVEPLTQLIAEAVEGRVILVTGAGGSIGSEICRQILRASPKRLVLLDHSEFGLYTIEQQLIEIAEQLENPVPVELVPVVGSMLNELLVRDLIRRHGVDTIYHAAAYKHVPLLENNEVVAVENNVVGTLALARLAVQEKLTRFVMISTDKAVRPESVMGASKRVAELIIQAFAREHPDTRFGIVRFGNVLDSSGSVVQRFRNQIRRGGPVTVTHPDITRYFMSIPEATQLVLQASAMAARGEVFVLDMGEPIRIADLAHHMITLSGMTVRDAEHPHGDVEIAYVGLRPGEKLYEELFVGADARPTSHPRIRMANERSVPLAEMLKHLAVLHGLIRMGDAAGVRAKLWELIAPDLATHEVRQGSLGGTAETSAFLGPDTPTRGQA